MLPFPRGDCNSFTKLHENFTVPPGPFWRFRLHAREDGGPGAVSPPGSRTAARLHGGRPFPIVSVLPRGLCPLWTALQPLEQLLPLGLVPGLAPQRAPALRGPLFCTSSAEINSACGKVRPSPDLGRRWRAGPALRASRASPRGLCPRLDAPYSRLSSSSRWASYPGLLPRGLPPSGGPSFALPRRRSTPPAARSGLRRTLGGAGAPGPLCGPPGQAPGASARVWMRLTAA